MRTLGLLALVVCAIWGAGCNAAPSGQRLRLRNDSAMPLKNLRVWFPDEQVAFGDIAPYTTTDYKVFANGVYGYAAYQYDWNGQTVTQPVIDWVGEKPLSGRAFTFTLKFDPTREQFMKIELTNVTRDQE